MQVQDPWSIENCKYEIDRLQSIVRDKSAAQTERDIAEDQLKQYQPDIETFLDRLYGGKN